MAKLTIRKTDPHDTSRFTMDERGVLHLYGRYAVTVSARDFTGIPDDAAATIGLYDTDNQALAVSGLAKDPMRPDCRTGTLDLSTSATLAAFANLRSRAYASSGMKIPRFVDVRLIVFAGGGTVISGEVPVELMPQPEEEAT